MQSFVALRLDATAVRAYPSGSEGSHMYHDGNSFVEADGRISRLLAVEGAMNARLVAACIGMLCLVSRVGAANPVPVSGHPPGDEAAVLAVVWTPYEFWLDGKRSHCGIDTFNLVKVDGNWRVANAMWTIEPEGCASLDPPAPAEMRPAR